MKPTNLYLSVVAAASLAVAGTAQAQYNPNNNNPSSSSPSSSRSSASSGMSSSSSSMSTGTSDMARVTKDDVEHRFTAKDLIGAGVYDKAGEKIGDISDIDLRGVVPGTLASSYNARENDEGYDATRTGSPAPTGGTMQSRSAQSPSSSSAMSSGRSLASQSGMEHATLFVSVGGLWGIGDDLVSIPASELSYNSSEKHFEVSASKQDVVALAEQKNEGSTYATGTGATSMGGSSAAKQSFGDDVSQVQNALRSDPETSSLASKLTVTSSGDEIEIRGTLDSQDQKQKVLSAARSATSKQVSDKIEVK